MLRVSLLKYILNYKYLLSSPKKNQYQRAPLSHHICSCFSADHCDLLCTTVLFTSILRIVACFANMLWTFLDWNVLLLTLVLMVILKIHRVAGAKKCYKEIHDSLRSEKCFFDGVQIFAAVKRCHFERFSEESGFEGKARSASKRTGELASGCYMLNSKHCFFHCSSIIELVTSPFPI